MLELEALRIAIAILCNLSIAPPIPLNIALATGDKCDNITLSAEASSGTEIGEDKDSERTYCSDGKSTSVSLHDL